MRIKYIKLKSKYPYKILFRKLKKLYKMKAKIKKLRN